jgi:hypothetical protein
MDANDKTVVNDELFKDLGINPNELAPELQKLYKSMQADYTKKTQAVAEKTKEFTAREQEYMQKLQNYGAMEQETTQWREWYKSLEEQTKGEDSVAQKAKEDELRTQLAKGEPAANAEMLRKLEEQIVSLKGEVLNAQKAMTDSSKRVDRMFNYQAQLNELAGKYPKLDKQKLLDHALKSGQMDLEKAYSDLYRTDIVEEEVQRRLKEELAKARTDGIHSSSRPMIIRKSEKPLSWEEATESIVRERAVQGKLD